MGKINLITRDISIVEDKISSLSFDTVQTDPHIRTQCFSLTRN
jgi:hypothetical protein